MGEDTRKPTMSDIRGAVVVLCHR